MGQVFTAFFAFIIQLFSAAEKAASSINNIATWADESTATFTDEARHNRQVRIKAMLEEEGIDALPKAEKKTVVAPKIK